MSETPQTVLHKVTALITRPGPQGVELLLFQHPNAGIQIPAGTVEPGESLDQAALREAREETGVQRLHLVRPIGAWEEDLGKDRRVMLRKATVYARPDPGSFAWAFLPRGCTVRLLRENEDYAQVSYEEADRLPDPQYITYQVTGWVECSSLARYISRHFYHLAVDENLPTSGWTAATDQHIFRPFWAPLAELPPIIPPQDRWLPYVKNELHYWFE